MEVDITNYFAEEEEITTDEDPSKHLDCSFLEGICPKCLDTGFVHTTKNGCLGVAYTTFSQDGSGNPIKKLMVCNHNIKVNC